MKHQSVILYCLEIFEVVDWTYQNIVNYPSGTTRIRQGGKTNENSHTFEKRAKFKICCILHLNIIDTIIKVLKVPILCGILQVNSLLQCCIGRSSDFFVQFTLQLAYLLSP